MTTELWQCPRCNNGKELSDLDVVIADSALFDYAWHELCDREMDESPKYLGQLSNRQRLLYRGQLDPTMFPGEMPFRSHWNRIFEEFSNTKWDGVKTRKVAAWIFKDWHFVQKYYRSSFKQILEKILRNHLIDSDERIY